MVWPNMYDCFVKLNLTEWEKAATLRKKRLNSASMSIRAWRTTSRPCKSSVTRCSGGRQLVISQEPPHIGSSLPPMRASNWHGYILSTRRRSGRHP